MNRASAGIVAVAGLAGFYTAVVGGVGGLTHLGQQAAAAGAGGGASAVGMVACCAHHVGDLAPFIGATGVAVFLTGYRLPIMPTGIGINAIGVVVAARRLRRTPLPAFIGR